MNYIALFGYIKVFGSYPMDYGWMNHACKLCLSTHNALVVYFLSCSHDVDRKDPKKTCDILVGESICVLITG